MAAGRFASHDLAAKDAAVSARSERLSGARQQPPVRASEREGRRDMPGSDPLAGLFDQSTGSAGRRLTSDERRLLSERHRRRDPPSP
jgi:hypothetical protein